MSDDGAVRLRLVGDGTHNNTRLQTADGDQVYGAQMVSVNIGQSGQPIVHVRLVGVQLDLTSGEAA